MSQRAGQLTVRRLEAPRLGDGRIDLDALSAALAPCDLLESADGSGWNYLAPHDTVARAYQLRDDGRSSTFVGPHGSEPLGTDPFRAIELVCERLGITPDADRDAALPGFTGGLVGALGYGLGARIETLGAPAAGRGPGSELNLRVAEVVVAVSADRDRALLVHRPLLTAERSTEVAAEIASRIRRVPSRRRTPRMPARQLVRTSLTRAAHEYATQRILTHIAAGDVFQVNLTRQLTARWEDGLPALYRALRRQSPAPLGAALPAIGVASISPETFLEVDGRRVVTRPIKGTRPRATSPGADAALADDLATAVKDRAENIMVVDMERNDLGRVCEPGSIEVPQLARVEEHPTVWHLVSSVAGRLRAGLGYGQLLRATFPCGSITGAPKIAAMQLISQLEPVARGWYCGAIGFLSPGAAHLSVAIRTATLHRDATVDYGAGGGIVADSDPDAEHAESLDKAAAFLRAVGAVRIDDGEPFPARAPLDAPPGPQAPATGARP